MPKFKVGDIVIRNDLEYEIKNIGGTFYHLKSISDDMITMSIDHVDLFYRLKKPKVTDKFEIGDIVVSPRGDKWKIIKPRDSSSGIREHFLENSAGYCLCITKTVVDKYYTLFSKKQTKKDKKMGHQIFWYVFNPRGEKPTVKHSSYEEALEEAKRLGKMYPAMTLHVLECVATVTSETKQIITEAVPEKSTEL